MALQNIIAPGIYPSQMTVPAEHASKPLDDRNSSAGFLQDTKYEKGVLPEERAGREEEMAGTILYLAGEAGGYCNGNVVVTDGGRLSVLPGSY